MQNHARALTAILPLALALAAGVLMPAGAAAQQFVADDAAIADLDGQVHEESHDAATWAARADVLLPLGGERFILIGELFGEDRLRPEYQLGVRSTLVPERLLVDLSWGGHTQHGQNGAGWALGLAWTPPPLF